MPDDRPRHTTTRRDFLKQTFFFSAALLLPGRPWLAAAEEAVSPLPGSHHLFAFGDWGRESSLTQQREVAAAMRNYATGNKLKVERMLLLGDNWYGWLFGAENSDRWKTQFEEMYPSGFFPGKCYAVLGNHDYEYRPGDKARAQLQYAKKGTRWTMPSKWYSFSFPETDPLIRFIALDSNYPTPGLHFFNTPTLHQYDVNRQNEWLRIELAKPTTAPFTSLMAHHPVFSNGDHGDTPSLIRDWQPLLHDHRVHLYLSGHDHDLQHLEFDKSPTSFVVSGGGGAHLRELRRDPASRGPYGQTVAGFTHIEVTREKMVVRHVDSSSRILHKFVKYSDGRVDLG